MAKKKSVVEAVASKLDKGLHNNCIDRDKLAYEFEHFFDGVTGLSEEFEVFLKGKLNTIIIKLKEE